MAQNNKKTVQRHVKLKENRWDSWAGTYDKKLFDFFRHFQKKAVEMARLKEGQSFLDIGCGTGFAVRYAAVTMNCNGNFYGIDLSSKMIEKAGDNSQGYRNVHFYKANVEAMPFESGLFDSAICTNSFHHYIDPSKALDEIYRVLKPGGRIYILDATTDGIMTKLAEKAFMSRQQSHVKLYSTGEFRELFTKSSLKYVTTRAVWPVKVQVGEK